MLFKKMSLCNIPLCLVRLLLYWYKSQMLCIKWGSRFSEFFGVSNGVRQGGVLSPYLYALYLNDLSTNLNAIKSGCVGGNALVNHLFFADICLLSPSFRTRATYVAVMQCLIILHLIVKNQLVFFFHPKDLFFLRVPRSFWETR